MKVKITTVVGMLMVATAFSACKKTEKDQKTRDLTEKTEIRNQPTAQINPTPEKTAANAWVVIQGGLKYQILNTGTADAKVATLGDMVKVHYTGWLSDQEKPGKKFDSSLDRGVPFKFPLGAERVIKGWDLGVCGMKVGEKRRLFIPADYGYGKDGFPPVIPQNAALIFDVELLEA